MAVSKTKKSFVKMKKIKAHLVECRKTQKLDMSSLELTEIPEDFMNLVKAAGVTSITELDLRSNQLSELTNEFAEFRTLRTLKLSKNRFQSLPAVVLRFAKIQVLDLSENELKELDLGIQFLVSLRDLNLSKNQLMMLPDFWGHFTLLVVLNLAKNRLMELPESMGSLRSLQRLDVSENLLPSLSKSLQHLQELVTLDAHGNHLVEVPPSLGLLKNLIEFDCSGNPLADPISTFYLQGFEKFMDYLRNQHELQQLEELIRQKPEGQILGSYKKYCARYESGQRPLLRSGFSVTQAGPITYIFGGRVTNYVKVEETYAIDSRTLLWVKLLTSGSMPTARDGHASAFDGNKRLYIFGGRNEENKLLNDVYYLDLKTMTWFQPPVEGSIPSVREGASMVVIGFQLIVFGGRGGRQRYNDVHVLDTQVWTWTLQNTRGSIPAPRQNAASTYSGTKFYVHGGKGSLLLEDLHALDTSSFTWSRVSQKGSGPCPRSKHTCWIYQNRLYVVGGLDIKGEPLSSLYVLPLSMETKTDTKFSTTLSSSNNQDKGSNLQSKNYMWAELDTELAPCLSNVFCHCGEKMILLQEGPQHAEIIPYCSEELSNLDGSSWDYYLEVNCDDLQPKVRDIQMERPMDSKTARVFYTKQTQMLQLPKSFWTCSSKEAHLLEYMKSYQRRFNQLHPERRLFMFVAMNECNIEKCICTTIRPSHADFIELFHWESCASFLADFLAYEPLEDPLTFPSFLPSPVSVLSWQRADSFDFAVVLVSFLTGSGYEAFCVVGYAPLHITTNGQEAVVCPYIALKDKEEKEAHQEKENRSSTPKMPKVTNTNYINEAPPALNGEYLEFQKHERDIQATEFVKSFEDTYDRDLRMGENEEEDNLFLYCKERPLPQLFSTEQPQGLVSSTADVLNVNPCMQNKASIQAKTPDLLDKKRLHCWVLVTTNKRDVPDYFFLEPSTGHRYSLQSSPYQGVEYIWNQHNIFINMQPNEDRLGIANVSWDLKDISKWERVLDTFLSAGDLQEPISASNLKTSNKKQDLHLPTNAIPGPLIITDASKVEGAPPSGNSAPVSLESNATVMASKSTVKAGATVGILKEGTEKTPCEDPAKNGFTKPYHWLLPTSWVPQLKIPMDAYVTRCPKGVKKTHYYRCTHELYSFYGDFVRWDGLIERIILYEDDERTNVLEIHDYFQRRKDGLHKRTFIPGANKVHDFFDPGASFGLKETEIIDGQSRKFLFYANSRTDGLTTRDEIIGKTTIESFTNHEACLIYRRACYGPPLPPPQDDFSPKPLSDRHLESVNETRGEASVKGSVSRPGSVRLSGRPFSHGGRMSVDSQKTRSRSRMLSRWQGR